MQRFTLLITALLFTLSGAARAADGAIEINQARATAGGITASDAPGFPVTIDAPGTYQLTGNLTLTQADGGVNTSVINISADRVTLDLNGFRIQHFQSCTGAPPFSCSFSGLGSGIQSTNADVRIANGTVSGAVADGIALGIRARIQDVRVRGCGGNGISVGEGSHVVDASSLLNFGDGVLGGPRVTVSGNLASRNGNGISTQGASVITGNVVNENRGAGIRTNLGSFGGSRLLENVAEDNIGLGLILATDDAYGRNVLTSNLGLQVSGGVQIGLNRCDTGLCP